MMYSVVDFFLSYLLLYKYAALFIIAFSSSVGAPIPCASLLLAVGAFSSYSYFDFTTSLVVAQIGNFGGDLTAYLLTRHYRMNIIRFLKLDRLRIFNRIAILVRTHAGPTIFITRFGGSLSPLTNYLAGMAPVGFITFIVYDFFGNLVYSLGLLSVGYILGDYWTVVTNYIWVIAGCVVLIVIGSMLLTLYRRKNIRQLTRG